MEDPLSVTLVVEQVSCPDAEALILGADELCVTATLANAVQVLAAGSVIVRLYVPGTVTVGF